MKFASLGSGSEGNALLISSTSGTTGTTVMLDCGFPIRETERRLQSKGMTPVDLAAIVVTHEHQDHVGGVFKFARRHHIPVWLSFGTYQAVQKHADGVDIHFCRDGDRLAIRDLELVPYTVPHDAREPVQYVVHDGQFRVGVLTDAGQSTPHLIQALGGCDALVLECNHDRQMLANSSYPYSLKQRIGGVFGHLSNETAAEILSAVDKSRLRTVVGAHLSQQNNMPELAREALHGVTAGSGIDVMLACQEEGFDWIHLKK
ncbi:MBL fold metallo-hydrolase [Noviherbaspirillum denitrificans]|uniref:MBL fold metallo-hydrolase n=1 Tax=Noviherbaspirillum denitrificans TaxID=1968433 RepID=A0A254TPS6_9BURK|nr:MBL fold metallo-hydrolase [Noviherbaspirillum denitrificans]OWW21728.1 MBL fold metallo-hydrolase [Noviherbaspirillum denitrificans]